MSKYNTGDAVPSSSMPNAWDNMQALDELVNGSGKVVVTRTGQQRDTFAGIQGKADDQRENFQTEFSASQEDMESRFSTQSEIFAGQFQAAQTDKENRFQAFLDSSGYVFLGDYEDGPLTITEYNQLVRYQNELWKITADTDIPFTTAGNTDESWNSSDKAHFVSVGDGALRQNLGSTEPGLGDSLVMHRNGVTVADLLSPMILEDIAQLRNQEPSFSGQRAMIKSRVSGWSASSIGLPWGGGDFIHVPNLPVALQTDDGGSIIKTANGQYWVRESLVNNNHNRMMVEWFLDAYPSFNVDASDNLQSAANAAALWSNSLPNTRKMKLVFPGAICIKKTVTIFTRGVKVHGNGGYVQVDSSGNYTAYSSISSNSNITPTPDGGATVKIAISLTHGDRGGVSNPAYANQEYIKDLNFTYGSPSSDSNISVAALSDNGVAAIGHWGTSTVGGAQGSFRNLSFQGFGIGYINGNNVWGIDFYECKFAGCYIPAFLIEGVDNSERINFFGCVMQNGYRCIYSPWGGDVRIFGGSFVWNSGPYFHIPKGGNMWDMQPSRIERVNTTSPLIIMSTGTESGGTSQSFPMCKLSGAMLLLDASTLLDDAYLFSVGKYCKLIVENNTWSNKNMTTLAKLKLLNPSDTGGKVIFRNNTCRVGIFSEMGRDNRLLTSKTPAGRASDITIGGANSGNASYSLSGGNLTFTVNTSGKGTLSLLIRVPVDVDMTDWDSLSWKADFSKISLSNNWSAQAFASVAGTNYINNRTDLGVVDLNSVSDISDVCSLNSYGYRKILKRADGGWDRVPSEFYLYISSKDTNQTAGETFTIGSIGLLGY